MRFDDRGDREHPGVGGDRESPPGDTELCDLLRRRVAKRYYDQPDVIDAVARIILDRLDSGSVP
jgi:hypothetical protein